MPLSEFKVFSSGRIDEITNAEAQHIADNLDGAVRAVERVKETVTSRAIYHYTMRLGGFGVNADGEQVTISEFVSDLNVTDPTRLIDEHGYLYRYNQCGKVAILFSHERDSDKLAIAAMRLYRGYDVVLCDEDNFMGQVFAQR